MSLRKISSPFSNKKKKNPLKEKILGKTGACAHCLTDMWIPLKYICASYFEKKIIFLKISGTHMSVMQWAYALVSQDTFSL